ncbi:hypothetical protein HMPREF2811_02525 [Globicatella sp. HMSC072A10]|uniref:DNA primase family protein n=1 Tax=Globicatella sp. HMSC072A10 TaxID=1739315 RepID=UPI0008AC378E|nr:DNA primase family protein [Globicatella sp. HMSC072A10]OFK63709.1 hypothetical protein HMPREF2811_02525 [Globicatella sp. HMSC072A10]
MEQISNREMPEELKELVAKVNKVEPINIKAQKPKSIEELKRKLSDLSYTMRDKGKYEKFPPSIIADILQREWYFKLIGTSRDYSMLYVFNPDTGIYDSSVNLIYQLTNSIEFQALPSDWKNVIEIIRIKVPLEKPNEHRHLIPVGNGIFNTKSKKLLEFNPKYIFTSKIETNYNPDAKLKSIDGWNVEDWLKSLVLGDEEMVTLLYQVLNEAINSNYTRKKIGFLVGEGSSGKGSFQQLIINLLGFSNIATLKMEEFGGDSNKFKKSMLLGKTCNIGDDISRTPVDSVSDLMSIATGDPISIEIKNGGIYSAQLKMFCLFSGNEMPNVKGNKSNGWYRRLLIIPFNANFNGKKENTKIKDEYIKDTEVLEYVLHKAINMNFEKFIEPEAVKDAISNYKVKNDIIRSYVIERYLVENYTYYERVPIKFIKSDFIEYLKENNNRHSTIPYGFVNEILKNLNELSEGTFEEKNSRFNEDYISTLPYEMKDFVKVGTAKAIEKSG